MAGVYSEALRNTIEEASSALGVEWRLNSEVEAIELATELPARLRTRFGANTKTKIIVV